jgi:hypothetical protein
MKTVKPEVKESLLDKGIVKAGDIVHFTDKAGIKRAGKVFCIMDREIQLPQGAKGSIMDVDQFFCIDTMSRHSYRDRALWAQGDRIIMINGFFPEVPIFTD